MRILVATMTKTVMTMYRHDLWYRVYASKEVTGNVRQLVSTIKVIASVLVWHSCCKRSDKYLYSNCVHRPHDKLHQEYIIIIILLCTLDCTKSTIKGRLLHFICYSGSTRFVHPTLLIPELPFTVHNLTVVD